MTVAKVKSSKTRKPKSSKVHEQPVASKKPPAAKMDRQPIHITFHIEKVVIQSNLGCDSVMRTGPVESLDAALGGDLAVMAGSKVSPAPPQVDLSHLRIEREITHWVDSVLLDALALKIGELMDLRSMSETEKVEVPRPPRPALELAYELFENPNAWLNSPNSQLGNRKPIDLLGTDEEFRVQTLLNAVDLGLF